jgi:photosystem II stability/assembly factor-like uncharacterized protein
MTTRARLLVGTRKGAFIYTADAARHCWQISEPIMPGWTISHMAADLRRDPPRLYAAGTHWAWGRVVAYSDDGGRTWEQRSPGLSFPEDMDVSVGNVWHVRPGHADQPGVVWAGVQPAGLFRSEDWGETWAPVDSINRHPLRPYWGGTGSEDSSLHSIEIDPRDPGRMYVSISSGGSYLSNDGGATWELCSHRALATSPMGKEFVARIEELFPTELPPNVDPAATDEMHKLVLDPKNPDRLWGQGHIGVFRSDYGAQHWQDVTHGLPSFHGFPIAVTKRDPDAVYVVPLAFEEDNFRVCRDQFAVYRSRNLGCTWERLTEGLPGPNDYQSVLREGLDTDGLDPEGVYVGTSNGQVYASADGGDHWQRLPGTLPPVLSVTSAVF